MCDWAGSVCGASNSPATRRGEMIDLPTCSTHNPCQGRKKITRPSLVAGSSRPMLTAKVFMQSLLITQNSTISIKDESHVPGE